MAQPTAQEILMIALINRARLDPAGEAARYGIDLNEGLAPGTLTATSKQPLSFNSSLFTAADAHSQSMIDFDYFAHTDPNTGSTPQTRGTAAGYIGGVGENIAFEGSTGPIDATAEIYSEHQELFVDSTVAGRGHRLNILNDSYQEVGVGQVIGVFTQNNVNYNSSMVTEDFGIPQAAGQFLTGVAYTDSDNDAFYSVGEGRASVLVTIAAGNQTTGTAGGYSGTIGTGAQAISFSGGGLPATVSLTATILANRDALIDLIGTSSVETSVSIVATANVTSIIGLGTNGLSLTGTSAANTITGTNAGDLIDGSGGADTMIGKNGDDVYNVDNPGDVVTENANEGTDLVQASVSFTLGANVENLTLTGTGNIDGTGNGLVNTITGNSGNNTLDGGTGADTMVGGAGNDIYMVDNAGDVVTEGANAGTDEVRTGLATYTLGANVENLTGTVNTGQTLIGNSLDNVIADGTGADTMIGGPGNDSYFVNNAGDVVTENANEGTDTVYATINATLAANVEYLVMQGSADLQGYGNTLSNSIVGNSGNNLIDGGAGADTMTGGAGNDTYFADNTNDAVIENANEGNDTVFASVNYTLGPNIENLVMAGSADLQGYGNSGANVLYGNSGNNLLNGGGGVDLMVGGAGNDVYLVDDPSDATFELPNQGNDTVFATCNYGLAADVENLILQGSADLQGYGNNQANVIYGNSGNNLLNGGGGVDLMVGGAGNDTYYVDDPSDSAFESPNEGTDAVFASCNYGLAANVETLVMQGSADLQGYGSNDVNTLYGNSGNNLLNGAGGADTMIGGAGNDTYFVDNTGDVVFENANEGTDSVFASVNYTLPANVEALVLQGGANLTGTGNALNNSLFGNVGNNTLDGAGGADVLQGNGGNDTFVFHAGQGNGDTVVDFAGNGAAAGDSLSFVGYGAGATFTNIDATHWQVNYNGGASHDVITFSNGAAIDATDFIFS